MACLLYALVAVVVVMGLVLRWWWNSMERY